MYEIDKSTKTFRQTVRLAIKRGYDMSRLAHTIILLASGIPLPPNYRDHPLKGNRKGLRECHVDGAGDWLLIYRKDNKKLILVLIETGTHADLFE